MARIVLAGDNHGDLDSIKKILMENLQADYYFHTGDTCLDPTLISPFITVCGNNDYSWKYNIPKFRVLNVENHNILLIHGHGYVYSLDTLVDKAKQEKCDIVMFGHTHCFFDEVIKGVHLINPGSTYYNRNGEEPCYLIVDIKENDVKISRKFI